jgi:hypothetical protein
VADKIDEEAVGRGASSSISFACVQKLRKGRGEKAGLACIVPEVKQAGDDIFAVAKCAIYGWILWSQGRKRDAKRITCGIDACIPE